MSSNLTEDDVRRIVRDELAEQLAAVSTGGVETETPKVEKMSENVMRVSDLKAQHTADDGPISARETIRRRYGLDPENFDSEDELRAAVRDRRGSA